MYNTHAHVLNFPMFCIIPHFAERNFLKFSRNTSPILRFFHVPQFILRQSKNIEFRCVLRYNKQCMRQAAVSVPRIPKSYVHIYICIFNISNIGPSFPCRNFHVLVLVLSGISNRLGWRKVTSKISSFRPCWFLLYINFFCSTYIYIYM